MIHFQSTLNLINNNNKNNIKNNNKHHGQVTHLLSPRNSGSHCGVQEDVGGLGQTRTTARVIGITVLMAEMRWRHCMTDPSLAENDDAATVF